MDFKGGEKKMVKFKLQIKKLRLQQKELKRMVKNKNKMMVLVIVLALIISITIPLIVLNADVIKSIIMPRATETTTTITPEQKVLIQQDITTLQQAQNPSGYDTAREPDLLFLDSDRSIPEGFYSHVYGDEFIKAVNYYVRDINDFNSFIGQIIDFEFRNIEGDITALILKNIQYDIVTLQYYSIQTTTISVEGYNNYAVNSMITDIIIFYFPTTESQIFAGYENLVLWIVPLEILGPNYANQFSEIVEIDLSVPVA